METSHCYQNIECFIPKILQIIQQLNKGSLKFRSFGYFFDFIQCEKLCAVFSNTACSRNNNTTFFNMQLQSFITFDPFTQTRCIKAFRVQKNIWVSGGKQIQRLLPLHLIYLSDVKLSTDRFLWKYSGRGLNRMNAFKMQPLYAKADSYVHPNTNDPQFSRSENLFGLLDSYVFFRTRTPDLCFENKQFLNQIIIELTFNRTT